MATWTDRTSFRTITEDGELSHEHPSISNGYDLSDFRDYVERLPLSEGEIAQWYLDVHQDGDSDLLAEAYLDDLGTGDLVIKKFPAADLFD